MDNTHVPLQRKKSQRAMGQPMRRRGSRRKHTKEVEKRESTPQSVQLRRMLYDFIRHSEMNANFCEQDRFEWSSNEASQPYECRAAKLTRPARTGASREPYIPARRTNRADSSAAMVADPREVIRRHCPMIAGPHRSCPAPLSGSWREAQHARGYRQFGCATAAVWAPPFALNLPSRLVERATV